MPKWCWDKFCAMLFTIPQGVFEPCAVILCIAPDRYTMACVMKYRIRFCAFRCCKSMILAEGVGHNDDGGEGEDEGTDSREGCGFAGRFHDAFIPTALEAVKVEYCYRHIRTCL